MTLELRDLGQPGESLKEVLLGFANALTADITSLPDNSVERIHDIRVGTKKINALLRLSTPPVDPDERRQLSALLREIRNTFAGSRDEEVLRALLHEIRDDPADIDLLGLTPRGDEALPETSRAAGLATTLTERIIALDLSGLTLHKLLENATASYRKARKLMRSCRKTTEDEAMHDWRKRTKDVCYHAMALRALKPQAARVEKLDALAEALGKYHDLALLEQRAIDHAEIAAAVEERKLAAGRDCFKAAAKIFRKSPRKFADRLERHARKILG